jgi:1,2-diacylglycerol 3-alpha-glucosyltransferase
LEFFSDIKKMSNEVEMKETILITSNAYLPNIGGVENSLRYLADSYVKMGFNVIVVVSDVSPDSSELPFKEIYEDITIYRYSTFNKMKSVGKYFRPIRSAFSAWKLLKSLNKNNNIILTLSRFHTATLLAKLAKLPNIVYLVPGVVKNQNSQENLIRGFGIKRIKLQSSLFLHHFIQKIALKHSDKVLVFSYNMAKQIAEISPKTTHIPVTKPGVDPARFHPVKDKTSLKIAYNIPHNKTILLTVGRFVRAKGFDLVIDAMAKLPECHLVMVGDGENIEQIRQQIIDNDVSAQVTLTGSQKDTSPFYQLADIFLMSSRYEPLGQTILEGLSSGLPIVAFKGNGVVTATQELLSEKEAIYTDNINADGLVDCILKLINDAHLMTEMSTQGRNIAVTRYSWLALAQHILDYRLDVSKHS